MTTTPDLPELPEPLSTVYVNIYGEPTDDYYSAEQMRAYALAALSHAKPESPAEASTGAGSASPAVSGEAVALGFVVALKSKENGTIWRLSRIQDREEVAQACADDWSKSVSSLEAVVHKVYAHPTGEVEKDAASELDIVAFNRVWDAVYSFVEPHRRHEAYQLALAAMNTEAKNG